MTQEDKQLLLKDLCARLFYGIIVIVNGNNERVDEINPFEGIVTCGFQSFDVEECKPYLRPMSPMTEKEKKQYDNLTPITEVVFPCDAVPLVDWLNKKMFDYRGLIEKGLAIEVTKENNPYKE